MTGWIAAALAILAALCFALWLRQREKRRLARMSRKLDDALAVRGLRRELSAEGEAAMGRVICAAEIISAQGFAPWVWHWEERRLGRMSRMLDDALAGVDYQRAVNS